MKPSQNLKNNFYFKKILKYCSLSIRSSFEIEEKLKKFENIEDELKNEILVFFLKIKVVLPDSDFTKYYLENLSDTKGYSFNQLYLKLGKRVRDKNKLRQTLKTFFKDTEESQIERFIEKNKRKLLRMELDQKRINYLTQRGFSYELTKKTLKTLTYNN